MKYAVGFTRSFSHFDEVDEVIFNYSMGNNIEETLKYVREDQRVIIDISNLVLNNTDMNNEVYLKLELLKDMHPNISVMIDFYTQFSEEVDLKEREIPFFYSSFARCYEAAAHMVAHGATDLYIVEGLAFDLKNLQYFRNKGVKLRVFPDIAQHAPGCYGVHFSEMTKFWIRPEDVDEYDKYVDVMEFSHRNEKLSTIFEIYKQKQWLGEIKDIVSDFHMYIDNTSIAPYFGPSRISCQQKCMIGRCNICMGIQDLAERFDKADIAIIKSKDKHQLTEEEKERILKGIIKDKVDESNKNEETMLRGDEESSTISN